MVERKKYGFIGNVADDTAALQGVFSLLRQHSPRPFHG